MSDLLNAPERGAWFTSKELRRRNCELEAHGRRICRTHQGAALPLDAAHFARCHNGLFFEQECIECRNARRRQRYGQDEAFAQQQRQRAKGYFRCKGRRERKRASLARVLEKASP